MTSIFKNFWKMILNVIKWQMSRKDRLRDRSLIFEYKVQHLNQDVRRDEGRVVARGCHKVKNGVPLQQFRN